MKDQRAILSGGPDAPLITLQEAAILIAAAIILSLPVLLYGPMVQGHDTYQHINFGRYFSEQFWHGEWYPRWLLQMNHGLGSPSLFIYPPFASYVYTLLAPAARIPGFNAFNIGEFLALALSGICAFLWIRTLAERTIAVAVAVIYMLWPYHLSVDFYRRTALSECWAFAWMPLVLYFTSKVRKPGWPAVAGLALAYAFLLLSHPVSAVIFSLLPVASSVMDSKDGQRLNSMVRLGLGMALGAGLASFYLLPALAHAKFFPINRLLRPPAFRLANHLIAFGRLLPSTAAPGYFFWVSWITLATAGIIGVCGFAILLADSGSKSQVIFWWAVCLIPGFLMLRWSARVWNTFPVLLRAVQYPWRFNIVLCLAATAMLAILLSRLPHFARPSRIAALSFVAVLVLGCLAAYGQVWKRYRTEAFIPRASINRNLLVSDDDGWFDSWSAPGMDPSSALSASAGPQVRFVEAQGQTQVARWQARDIEFRSDSQNGGWVVLNQFYYPAWKAYAMGASSALRTEPKLPEGLLEIDVPRGEQQIHAEIPVGISERLGQAISATCLLITVIMFFDPGRAHRGLACNVVSDVLQRSKEGQDVGPELPVGSATRNLV